MNELPDHVARYWGKAGAECWHPLAYHALDVAAVGAVLIEADPDLRRRFEALVPGIAARLPFLLALHDIGKFATSFQRLRADLFDRLRDGQRPSCSATARHDSLGFMLWREALSQGPLAERLGGRRASAWNAVISALTGHHGLPPYDLAVDDQAAIDLAEAFTTEDITAASDFAEDVGGFLAKDTPPPDLRHGRADLLSWWLAGFAVLCDWIGSNADWFGYRHPPDLALAEYWEACALPQARKAVARTDAVPVTASERTGCAALFPRLFEAHEPSPLQRFAEGCDLANGPQVFVLEDLTGAGKTEAALVLAHRLMAEGLGSGAYIALPTQATANAMYARMASAYRRLFAEGAEPSIVLAHGRRAQVEMFREAVIAGTHPPDAYGGEEETASARCNPWLADNRKKSLLAQLGVGTVDQALLAVLPAAHQSLRLFGVARKVLIVDEVHAYDAYMQALLCRLLAFQAALGGSAILMSATLPKAQRRELIAAFAKGRGIKDGVACAADAYPLATSWAASKDGGQFTENPLDAAAGTSARAHKTFRVERLGDRDAALEAVCAAAEAGGCVCWVRNTVDDAREAFDLLAGRIPAERLTLFHARFAFSDRARIEAEVLCRFGKESGPADRAGQVLVATQVVEQSLDLDFDAMVTDLAPVDLLIQRAGRLHRHDRGARGEPVLRVLGPPPDDPPPSDWHERALPRAKLVYPDGARLWLGLGELLRRGEIDIRRDARPLIEAVYGEEADRSLPDNLILAYDEADGREMADRQTGETTVLSLRDGYQRGFSTPWADDEIMATRLGEPTVTLRLGRWDGGRLLPWAAPDGDPADLDAWAASEVGVRISLVAAEAAFDTALAAAATRVKEAVRDRFRWQILVPLTAREDGVWEGVARRDGDGQPRERRLAYHPDRGLSFT